MKLPPFLRTAAIVLAWSTAAGADLAGRQLVDLSHSYDRQTLYWPTAPSRFELEPLAYGDTEAGFLYAANAFCTTEHGGTHIDAPIHFARNRSTVEQIPLHQLVAPAAVIDVTTQAARDRDYRLAVRDVLEFEARHGRLEAGTIVLLRTGWSRFWPEAKAYLGDDTPGDASQLSFPSFGADAARLLVEERQAGMLGVDSASIDFGSSRDVPEHRIAAARNVPGLENLANLERLPPRGALVVALPMKIGGGSGGPVRVIAILPTQ